MPFREHFTIAETISRYSPDFPFRFAALTEVRLFAASPGAADKTCSKMLCALGCAIEFMDTSFEFEGNWFVQSLAAESFSRSRSRVCSALPSSPEQRAVSCRMPADAASVPGKMSLFTFPVRLRHASSFWWVAFLYLAGITLEMPVSGQSASMFSPEFLCLGAACDLIKCSSNAECPPFHTCTGYSTSVFGKGTGLFGGNGLGVGQLLGQPIRGSGGFLSASPAVAAGVVDGVWSALAPELKPPIKTLFNPNFCEPSELRQPSNIVTPGGYFVTTDMQAWAPPGPERIVDLPEASTVGTLYNTPSINQAFAFRSATRQPDRESPATRKDAASSAKRQSLPQASINGGLIQFSQDMNQNGQTVMVARSVYEGPENSVDGGLPTGAEGSSWKAQNSNNTRSAEAESLPRASQPKSTRAADAPTASAFRPRKYKEVHSTVLTSDPASAAVSMVREEPLPGVPPAQTQSATEPLKPSLKVESQLSLLFGSDGETQSVPLDEKKKPTLTTAPPPGKALEETVQSYIMQQIQALDDTQVDLLFQKLLGDTSLFDETSKPGNSQVVRSLQMSEKTNFPEGLDALFDLGLLAAGAAAIEFFPFNKRPLVSSVGVQNPIQFGMNVMNAKWEAQIHCLTPVATAYSPLGTVIVDLANRSDSPSIIRNDLFEAFIKGNRDNSRKPLVSVVEVSNLRDVRRDFVLIVCSRPGRFTTKFQVDISFAGQEGTASNVCPIEVLCQEGLEIPPSELALFFETDEEEGEQEELPPAPPTDKPEKKKKKKK
ncbi:hypothetical protein TGRUB_278840 [Toxoplasma gondii RUB]|uniref:Uncharacterized protein n=1 Tax=Toxoplasma gondii RUB TaxID=935652 RepID=A0A086LPE8_TOXGO|nr:hypothetical protein TGRUB_278840 [Toxoplasma gondii RUB]